MSTPALDGARPDPLGRALLLGSTALAILGGLVLIGMTAMTVVSILGRALASAPVTGDFELVELGMAVAIFAFLPYCQITRGNVIVDIVTYGASARTKALLDMIGDAVFTAVAAVLTWRLALGLGEAMEYGESTMLLRIPTWWGYVPAVLFTAFLTVVTAYTTWRCYVAFRSGTSGAAP
jgi:TRAP-type C4-dicarboxylate transport system permease small subunit